MELDHVEIRRHLVDYGIIARSVDGEKYSFSEEFSAVANWDFVVSVSDRKS